MTLTSIGVFFSIKTNLYYRTNFLSMKHIDTPKSISVWASIIISLLHLTMIGTKKHGVRSKDKLGPFSIHDASRSSLVVPTKVGHVHFSTPLVVD
jgi:hypothetical protein